MRKDIHPEAERPRIGIGDGHQDLVLAHPGGLRGKELLVNVYRSRGNGQFDPKPRSWKLGA